MPGKPAAKSTYAVLCVDDEPALLEALGLVLGRRYHVELAASGAAALEKLRACPEMPVIISDMRMPQMDGAQFLCESRQIAPNARRILLTGHADMKSAIAAVNDGRIFRYMTKPCETAELVGAVEAAIADYEAEMRDRSDIRRSVEHEMLGIDRLTGLASRERLLECICLLQGQTAGGASAAAVSAGAVSAGAAVFLAEIVPSSASAEDHDWRAVEHLLCVFAERLKGEFASADCIARYGSNSLGVVLTQDVRTVAAQELAGLKLLDTLEMAVEMDGIELKPSLRIGIAPLASADEDPRAVMRRAELAVQEANRTDRNSVHTYSSEERVKAEHRRELGRALRASIAREELTLHYQPVIDLEHGRLHTVEALARWQHPEFGSVPPSTFIPMAEKMNLMVALGDWALNHACRTTRDLLGQVCPRVSVNVSVTQILDVGFLPSVFQALERNQLDPRALELEVTESVFARDLDTVCGILLELRNWGVNVAIDDFGAGYSSLHYLNRLPVNVVKVDSIFARDFDRGGQAIISAAISIAKTLKFDCVIEGIETPSMLDNVRTLGATIAQGYLFARPMPEPQLREWLIDFRRDAASSAVGESRLKV